MRLPWQKAEGDKNDPLLEQTARLLAAWRPDEDVGDAWLSALALATTLSWLGIAESQVGYAAIALYEVAGVEPYELVVRLMASNTEWSFEEMVDHMGIDHAEVQAAMARMQIRLETLHLKSRSMIEQMQPRLDMLRAAFDELDERELKSP